MTAQLSPTPVQRFFDNNGFPAFLGTLTTYAAGTTTLQATYVDSTQTTQNTNPVQLNARGECNLWLDPTLSYKFVLQDVLGNLIWTVDNINGALSPSTNIVPTIDNNFTLGSPTFSWKNIYVGVNHAPVLDTVSGNIGYYARTAAEIAAGVTPVNYAYAPGNILRYGTNTTPGTTDMTTALQGAVNCNARVYIPSGTYLFSNHITLASNSFIYGDGDGTVCTFNNPADNQFIGTNITDAVVRDLKITVTGTAGTTYIGAVSFQGGSTDCLVENVSISGVSGCHVFLSQVSRCIVRGNRFRASSPTNNDTADVYLTSNATAGCQYCIIENNECFGSGYFGVSLETQGIGNQPNLYNIVKGNRIGQHQAYGVNQYSGAANADCFTQIIGNYIENIQGNVITGNSGAGIYVVSAGGTLVANNTIRNCCVQTSSQSLAPAGIGVSSITAGLSPVVVSGNLVSGMTKYNGIYVVSCAAGVEVSGNSIIMPNSNTTGNGINIGASSFVDVTGNTVQSSSNQAAILVNATGSNAQGINVIGNQATHSGVGLLATFASSFTITDSAFNDNTFVSTSNVISMNLSNLARCTISGNTCNTATALCMTLSACTQTRVTGNTLYSSSNNQVISTAGTCTDSYIDKTNYLNATGGANTGLNAVSNAGTGCVVEQLVTATPATGTSAVGDRGEQRTPVVGQPKGWRCTVAGANPGSSTWVSEGNL